LYNLSFNMLYILSLKQNLKKKFLH